MKEEKEVKKTIILTDGGRERQRREQVRILAKEIKSLIWGGVFLVPKNMSEKILFPIKKCRKSTLKLKLKLELNVKFFDNVLLVQISLLQWRAQSSFNYNHMLAFSLDHDSRPICSTKVTTCEILSPFALPVASAIVLFRWESGS